MTRSKPVIGLTGNSGSGKGTVCGILRRMGAFCIDADKLAHQVMEYGRPAYTEIADEFGVGVISADGSIDRRKLGAIVFRDPSRRGVLERIVHSKVIGECLRLTSGASVRPEYAFVVWDAPLLIEAGMHLRCDAVFLVAAPFALRLSRILARDNITEEQAKLRMASQTPQDALYKKLIDDIGESRVTIIKNDGNLYDLTERTRLAAGSIC